MVNSVKVSDTGQSSLESTVPGLSFFQKHTMQ